MSYRLFRMDREDVLLPLLRDLEALSRRREVVGRESGYSSEQFNDACEAMRARLYNEQTAIITALHELKDATDPEVTTA